MMVAVAWESAIAAPLLLLRLTKKASSGSNSVSLETCTVMVFSVSPGANSKVPLVAI